MSTSARPVFGLRDDANQPVLDSGGNRVLFEAPYGFVFTGVVPSESVILGWNRYTGLVSALNQSCAVTPAPATGGPVWTRASTALPAITAGLEYGTVIFIGDSATAATGQTIVGIRNDSGPSWLTVAPVSNENGAYQGVSITGTAPSGLTGPVLLTLSLLQSDGQTTARIFSITVNAGSSSSVYSYQIYRAPTQRLTVYVGGDSPTAPTIQLLSGPDGYGYRDAYTMDRLASADQSIPGQSDPYYFSFGYNYIISGTYIFKIVHQGVTRYLTLTILEEVSESGVVTLLTSQPTLPTQQSPSNDGDAVEIVNNAPTVVNPTDFITVPQGQALVNMYIPHQASGVTPVFYGCGWRYADLHARMGSGNRLWLHQHPAFLGHL